MTNLEALHACAIAETGSSPAEQADDLDDEPRRDESFDSIFKEESQKSGELDDALPEGVPEYGDLLDGDWLERGADNLEMEEEVVDVGLTLDLAERDDLEDGGLAIEFDVGSLLTLLPSEVLPSRAVLPDAPSELLPSETSSRETSSRETLPSDGFGAATLDELLLPEEGIDLGLDRGDDDVGDDERFPAFDDGGLVPSMSPSADEDVPTDGGDLD